MLEAMYEDLRREKKKKEKKKRRKRKKLPHKRRGNANS
jgi:hypothetical protein